ncbi:hypothetical protein GCM10020295_37950 [Streptomyces cinereospinus]
MRDARFNSIKATSYEASGQENKSVSGRWSWILSDGLREPVRPLLPPTHVCPQRDGTQNTQDPS